MTQAMEYVARVFLRYGIGAVFGAVAGTRLAADPDVVALVAVGLSLAGGAAVEWWTARARKAGRKT